MLHFDNLAIRRGPRLLFGDASLQIHPGQKVGLTGANGTGKSSLFALILGELHADLGDLTYPQQWVIAHVAQEMPVDHRAALEYVLDGDAELRLFQRQLAAAEASNDGHEVAVLHGRLADIGGYEANSRAAKLLHGLGFTSVDEQRPVSDFSGGWRMRLNLAKALMCRSDLLLLDEPTNHLDLDAIIWLENWLAAYPGTLLLISHDRDFLDQIADHIMHIEHEKMTLYAGNYSAFERTRAERLANQQAEYEKQQREMAHMRSYVERFRAKATKARQAQSRLKALARMDVIVSAHVDSPFHFEFKAPEKQPNPLVKLDAAAAGYDGKAILSGVNLALSPGDRIGLLGRNGAGKSTLIKLLVDELGLMAGERAYAADYKVGYFAQHQLELLHPESSPLEHMHQLDKQATEQSLRDFLGGFGFIGDRALEACGSFSGGEKSRLVLAMVVYQRPNLLLLDEPTNHLDLEMRQALAQALQGFEGAMVLVSHDRHLLRVTADRLLLVHDGKVDEFQDALDDYPAWLAKQNKQQKTDIKTATPSTAESAVDRKQRKRDEAAARQQLKPWRQKISKIEKLMEQLQAKQQQLETLLADNSLYAEDNSDKLKTLITDKAAIDAELETQEMAWMEASEALEELMDEAS